MAYPNYPTVGMPSGAGMAPYAPAAPLPAHMAGYSVPGLPSGTAQPVPGYGYGGPLPYPGSDAADGVDVPGHLPAEQSYIENILRLNLGKRATIYMTFENNAEWNAKIFKGIVEAAGRDHIIISDPATGMRYLLLMVNLDYVTFDEPLNYDYPY